MPTMLSGNGSRSAYYSPMGGACPDAVAVSCAELTGPSQTTLTQQTVAPAIVSRRGMSSSRAALGIAGFSATTHARSAVSHGEVRHSVSAGGAVKLDRSVGGWTGAAS